MSDRWGTLLGPNITEERLFRQVLAKDSRGKSFFRRRARFLHFEILRKHDARVNDFEITDNEESRFSVMLQIPIQCTHSKGGLGSSKADFPNIELDANVEKKQAVWRKTQKRYKETANWDTR